MSNRMPSVNKHSFQAVPSADIQRSSFDRSHGHKTTFNAGELVPCYVDEALPGDTFSLDMAGFARMATPLHPLMDNLYLETFFFAVPYRLVWDNWQRFNGEQDAPGDPTDYLVPGVTTPAAGFPANTIADYFGIPTLIPGMQNPNALHFRAYNLIWNEWFRDQNLQAPAPVSKDDGPDLNTSYVIRRRGKRHDYFTSCLPWPQKGEDVTLPLGTSADIVSDAPVDVSELLSAFSTADQEFQTLRSANTQLSFDTVIGTEANKLYADLTNATAATINDIREAFQIQKLYERDARGGTRYTEIIKSHFGVTSPDSRLQRPEYLGGGSSHVNISEVQQTVGLSASAENPGNLGDLGATGRVGFQKHGFNKSFTEHCVILGFVCVRADLNYQQGLNRMWSRQTRFDYYWPTLAHLGEQAVLNQEIYAQGDADPGVDSDVFGYQERYAEYRYKPSLVTGEFRSNFPQSLDTWHLSQDFDSLPALNNAFIQENPPVDRAVAVQDSPHFIADTWFNLRCARPMPTYSVPGLIDHF